MGDTGNRYDGFDPYIRTLIKEKAKKLLAHNAFNPDDQADVEQELALDLLRRLPRHDAGRAGLRTFAARVVEHHLATMIEERQAAVRDYRKESGSLDERVVDEEGNEGEAAPVLANPTYERSVVEASDCEADQRARRIDLQRLMDGLPGPDQDLCERLKTKSISEISRESGIPRSTLYGQLMQLRTRFEKAGLAAYLNPSDRFRSAPVCKQPGRDDAAPDAPGGQDE